MGRSLASEKGDYARQLLCYEDGLYKLAQHDIIEAHQYLSKPTWLLLLQRSLAFVAGCQPAPLPRRAQQKGACVLPTVLIVDDDQAIRETLRLVLEDAGYGVLE